MFKNFKNNASNEYRAVTIAFYSFIVMQALFFLLRVVGIDLFKADTNVNINISKTWYTIIMFLFYWLEAFFILKILTNKGNNLVLIISLVYSIVILLMPDYLIFITELAYAFLIPLTLNKSKSKSLLWSALLFVAFILYQLLMMVGRYDITINAPNFNLSLMAISFVEYKLFIVNIYLFLKLRRIR